MPPDMLWWPPQHYSQQLQYDQFSNQNTSLGLY
jgi:hypothetical protein